MASAILKFETIMKDLTKDGYKYKVSKTTLRRYIMKHTLAYRDEAIKNIMQAMTDMGLLKETLDSNDIHELSQAGKPFNFISDKKEKKGEEKKIEALLNA